MAELPRNGRRFGQGRHPDPDRPDGRPRPDLRRRRSRRAVAGRRPRPRGEDRPAARRPRCRGFRGDDLLPRRRHEGRRRTLGRIRGQGPPPGHHGRRELLPVRRPLRGTGRPEHPYARCPHRQGGGPDDRAEGHRRVDHGAPHRGRRHPLHRLTSGQAGARLGPGQHRLAPARRQPAHGQGGVAASVRMGRGQAVARPGRRGPADPGQEQRRPRLVPRPGAGRAHGAAAVEATAAAGEVRRVRPRAALRRRAARLRGRRPSPRRAPDGRGGRLGVRQRQGPPWPMVCRPSRTASSTRA
ncbi:hypothetical protein SNARM312S_01024 [Streptomyces narbonensis]